MAVAVFRHPPGRGGRTESYIIGPARDLFAHIPWGEKKLGEFVGIVEEWPGCPTDPYFVLVWSFSLKSKAAQAKAARDELKRFLPKKLHRLITLARRINASPRWRLLEIGSTDKRTKEQLFIDEVLNEEDRRAIGIYMDPHDFWRAATGRVPHDKIAELITQQLAFDLDNGAE